MRSVGTLTRADLAESINRRVGLSRADSLDMVESILNHVCDALAEGENVKISGFGTFLLRDKAERVGRNPKTGVEIAFARPIDPRLMGGANLAVRRVRTQPKGARAAAAKAVGGALDVVDIAKVFNDGKDAAALRTIGEVARALGLRQHVLRYWEDQFPMLRPLTRAGGRRYYRHDDIALLITIDRLLHREGYTIRGARQALAQPAIRRPRTPESDASPAPAQPLGEPIDPAPEQAILGALGVLRRHLESIRARLADSLN
eukprot:gene3576-3622_t